MASKTATTRGKAKPAHKGKKKMAVIVGVPGPPPTDIQITGSDVGYVAGSVGGSTVVVFSSDFHISGTVTPVPVPAAQVDGYIYSMGQHYNAASTMTDAAGNWTLHFVLPAGALGSDAQIKVIVDVPGDPASQVMSIALFGFFDTGLFDELPGRDGHAGR